jgi:multisubunit Na+/H+ antiporter MnhF subunit
MKEDKDKSLSGYRIGKLTILQIMAVLAIIGLVSTWALHHFFST